MIQQIVLSSTLQRREKATYALTSFIQNDNLTTPTSSSARYIFFQLSLSQFMLKDGVINAHCFRVMSFVLIHSHETIRTCDGSNISQCIDRVRVIDPTKRIIKKLQKPSTVRLIFVHFVHNQRNLSLLLFMPNFKVHQSSEIRITMDSSRSEREQINIFPRRKGSQERSSWSRDRTRTGFGFGLIWIKRLTKFLNFELILFDFLFAKILY